MRRIKSTLTALFLFAAINPAFAATYYAVATGNWSSTSTWSTSSGGAPGAGPPGSTDAAIFDSASGAITVTVDTNNQQVASITANGFTGTLINLFNTGTLNVQGSVDFSGMTGTFNNNSRSLIVNGNLTLGSGMSFSNNGSFGFNSSGTLTTNGVSTSNVALNINISGGGTVTLADNLIVGAVSSLINFGILDAATNNVNVTAGSVTVGNSSSSGLNMGSGTWTITGNLSSSWNVPSSASLNAGTSLLKFTGSFTNDTRTQTFGGHTYYNVENATTGGNSLIVNDSGNTFHNFTADAGTKTKFLASSTNTATAWAFNGTSGSPATLASKTAGTFFTLSQASGTVNATYTTISDSHATGGAIFNALTSSGNVDDGGNSGWNFSAPSTGSHMLMPGVVFGDYEPWRPDYAILNREPANDDEPNEYRRAA